MVARRALLHSDSAPLENMWRFTHQKEVVRGSIVLYRPDIRKKDILVGIAKRVLKRWNEATVEFLRKGELGDKIKLLEASKHNIETVNLDKLEPLAIMVESSEIAEKK